MVIGVNEVLARTASQQLRGPVGDHLVGVHVVAGSGAGLERIHHELRIPLHVHDFLGGLGNRVHQIGGSDRSTIHLAVSASIPDRNSPPQRRA